MVLQACDDTWTVPSVCLAPRMSNRPKSPPGRHWEGTEGALPRTTKFEIISGQRILKETSHSYQRHFGAAGWAGRFEAFPQPFTLNFCQLSLIIVFHPSRTHNKYNTHMLVKRKKKPTSTLSKPVSSRHRQRQNLLGRMLRHNDDRRRGVSGDHARENGGVDDKKVVGSIDLGVEVDHRGAVGDAPVVGSDLGGSCCSVSNLRDNRVLVTYQSNDWSRGGPGWQGPKACQLWFSLRSLCMTYRVHKRCGSDV